MRPINAIKYSENLVWLIGHGEFSSPQDALRRALYDLAQTSTLTIDDLRPKGRWLHRENGVAYCSECEMDAVEDGTNFCPECGAKMENGA